MLCAYLEAALGTAEQKRKRRRRVLPGYPKDTVFSTAAELDAYFANVRLTCLECGQKKKTLGGHLLMHDMTAEAYKEIHGIPWTYGLTGCELKEVRREIGRKNFETGVFQMPTADLIKKAAEAPERKRQPPRRDICKQNLSKVNAGKTGIETARRAAVAQRTSSGLIFNRGERSHFAKLTDAEVVQIKAMLADGTKTQREIAQAFGVSQGNISSIKTGATRKDAGREAHNVPMSRTQQP